MAERSFAYDEVPYDTEANTETHPSSIATLAHLAGLSRSALSTPPSRARVLEIGCGNGENLLAAATYLPHARFVGFDLARTAIAAGNAAAAASRLTNVELFAADICEVRKSGSIGGADARGFDYVVAHGMYSWVPELVRADLLALMRDALTPHGIGFLSINALPGWELRRAIRELARDRTASIDDPGQKVAETLRLVSELGRADAPPASFVGVLSAAAREYEEATLRARPPEAPWSRDVFHDLLADVNDPFTVGQLSERLARAGLRIVCETPLRTNRARDDFGDLARDMDRTGTPFLQVLVQRDDAPAPAQEIAAGAVGDLRLWADFLPAGQPGVYRTTTGALLRPVGEQGLARAVSHAPGFVAVGELTTPDAREALAKQLFDAFVEGVLVLVTEDPPVVTSATGQPRIAEHVRTRAAAAAARGAPSAIVTSALHRSFRVAWPELAVIALLDGTRSTDTIAGEILRTANGVVSSLAGPLKDATPRDAEAFVRNVIDRFRRHLFLVGEGDVSDRP